MGHEGGPLVVGSTLYIVTPFPNNLIALDLNKPGFPQKWIFHPYADIKSVAIACCDVVNRGVSYADVKITYNTLDAHAVAVDANTGKLAWNTEVDDIHYGETTTMAPVVVKNTVFVGNSGADLAFAASSARAMRTRARFYGRNIAPDRTRTFALARISSLSTQKIAAKIWA
jgi:lanthanide-dependent methanol dehydrogenase